MARSPADSSEKENSPNVGGAASSRKDSASSKGKQRRVEEQPSSPAAEEPNEMEVDDEEEAGQASSSSKSKKNKGKAAAGSSSRHRQAGSDDEAEAEQNDHEEDGAVDGQTEEAGEKQDEYDPDQPLHEKRKVRRDYRDLTSKLVAAKARDPDAISAESLSKNIKKANEFFGKVKTPAEAVLDSNFLMLAADVANQQARKLKVGGDYFDTNDFLSKVKILVIGGGRAQRGGNARGRPGGSQRRRLGSDDDEEEEEDDDDEFQGGQDPAIGWDKIGQIASRHTLRVPPIDFMLGPIAIPPKKKIQKKQRARQEKLTEKDKVQAKEIGHDDVQLEKQTTELVMHVSHILERVGNPHPSNLFRFIINPESFSQTIENIFYMSFLVKENKASIEYDEQGEPTIYACEPTDASDKAEGINARQLVLELDMQMWRDAIEAYDIKKSCIPTRQYQQRQKGKWYG